MNGRVGKGGVNSTIYMKCPVPFNPFIMNSEEDRVNLLQSKIMWATIDVFECKNGMRRAQRWHAFKPRR